MSGGFSDSTMTATATTGRLLFPMLTRTNYVAWAMRMKYLLRTNGAWGAVDPEKASEAVDESKDQLALMIISQSIDDETLLRVADKETASDVWAALSSMHVGESVDDFAAKFTALVGRIRELGDAMHEKYVVKKLRRGVSTKFVNFASSLILFTDINKMAMEESIRSLKAHEELLKGREVQREEQQPLMTRARDSSGGRGHGRYGWKDKSKAVSSLAAAAVVNISGNSSTDPTGRVRYSIKTMPRDDSSRRKAIVSTGFSDSTMTATATTGRLPFPMLTRTNYVAWAMRMKYLLRTNGTWVAEKETASDVWAALSSMHVGESVDDFAVKFTTLVGRIHELGDAMDEKYVVKKLLRAVSTKFVNIASSLILAVSSLPAVVVNISGDSSTDPTGQGVCACYLVLRFPAIGIIARSSIKTMPCDDSSPSKAIVSGGFSDSTMMSTATTGRLPFPMLTRTNYMAWAMRMKYLLRTNGAWGAVDPEKTSEAFDESKDQLALTIFSQSIDDETCCELLRRRPPLMCGQRSAACGRVRG
ncbi:hypothetical protein E2562_024546 [Oryza meyeriana var. granulata]|uniref:Uncharacterized protein n=1 Tax=Oryza meyeriana var. granulata TaxID=110450 RepID=A0A6G1BNY0_9ORYZ|nr:hypothetical protein E2562_024546 [Oryza meyeriana var. granulata]